MLSWTIASSYVGLSFSRLMLISRMLPALDVRPIASDHCSVLNILWSKSKTSTAGYGANFSLCLLVIRRIADFSRFNYFREIIFKKPQAANLEALQYIADFVMLIITYCPR